ncbi:MAG: alpha/beta fold hydrolase [Aquisalinus sp.]|nr:alpha/beta fold hydrolase [Aquisalinus sp.]
MYMNLLGNTVRALYRNANDEKRPLLVCNGLGQAVEVLFPLLEQFPDRPVIVFDAVGVGKSSVPGTPLSIPEHAKVAKALLTELDVDEYDVLGISWGGSVTQQLAFDDSCSCKKLILAVTSAGGIGSWWGTPVALSEIFLPLRYTSKEYGNFVGPLMYGGEAITTPELFKEYSKNSIAPSHSGYFGQVVAMCSWTSLGWLHQLKQPTLVICGIFDGLIPAANQFLLAQRIPRAELEIFQAGHLLMYSRRDEVGELITRFLDRRDDLSTSSREKSHP